VFKSAIIGCGRIAGGYDPLIPLEWSATHAGAYHLCPDTKLIAVADPNPEALKAFQQKWGIDRGYFDYREMLEKENPDIVSLCLPTEHHYKAFEAVTERNIKAIFCEKPLSYDLGEAKSIVEMGRDRIVAVNYFRRWNPTLISLAQGIKKKDFGKVVSVTVRYTKGLFVNGSHLVDLMRWFFGEPSNINTFRIASDDILDSGIDFSLQFDDGVTIYYINIPEPPYVFIDVDILAERGRIVIGQRGQKLTRYPVIREPHYDLFDIIGNCREQETEWRNCVTRAVQEIAGCLKYGGKTSCTLMDGFRAIEICQQVFAGTDKSVPQVQSG